MGDEVEEGFDLAEFLELKSELSAVCLILGRRSQV